jgi:hypothetical protein
MDEIVTLRHTGQRTRKLRAEHLNSEDSVTDSVGKIGRVLSLLLLVVWGLSFVWGYSNSVLMLNILGLLLAVIGLRFPGIGLWWAMALEYIELLVGHCYSVKSAISFALE